MTNSRPERDVRRKMKQDEDSEAEDRDYADWAKDIGPEGMSPERVEEYLQEYGWNHMDEGDFVSNPVTPADMPDWAGIEKDMVDDNYDSLLENDLERAVIDLQSQRPVEDKAIEELDGDEPDEEET
jgi:hypothetical protein